MQVVKVVTGTAYVKSVTTFPDRCLYICPNMVYRADLFVSLPQITNPTYISIIGCFPLSVIFLGGVDYLSAHYMLVMYYLPDFKCICQGRASWYVPYKSRDCIYSILRIPCFRRYQHISPQIIIRWLSLSPPDANTSVARALHCLNNSKMAHKI